MARLVRLTLTDPLKIDPATLPPDKKLAICQCGLSQTFPLCDGAHRAARLEAPDTLTVYAPDRKTIIETRPDTP